MVTIAENLTSRIQLNDGHRMPMFGLGMYRSEPGQDGVAQRAVTCALQNGYRMIDTATIYSNQMDVARGIKESGVKREDVYIVSKLWNTGHKACRDELHASLRELDTDYIDLYLIHSPNNGHILESYKAMMEFQQKGLIRSIGVSNFGVHHLEEIKKAGLPTPAVNQFELNPWNRRPDLVTYCRDQGITVMGYAPIMKAQKNDDPLVVDVAKRLNKSVAQVLIRYSVQKGFITIPKATKLEHIIQNADVFDWSCPEVDMAKLSSFPEKASGWNPTVTPWKG